MLATRVASSADIAAIQALAQAQAERHHALDDRLPEGAALSSWQILLNGGVCWVAESEGQLVGALCAEREQWFSDSPFANVFPRRYLRLRLFLANGASPAPVLDRLLDCAARWPDALAIPGRMIMTPARDAELAAALEARGFAPYHAIAHRSLASPPTAPAAEVTIRPARRGDLLDVAALMADSWRFHAAYQPAIILTDHLLDGCQEQAWQLAGDGAAQTLLLAEQGGEVIGFFGMGISVQQPEALPSLFATGLYGDIFEVAVRADQRRRGVGLALFRAAWQWFEARGAAAMFVNYAPTNPISSRFWPKLGFADAWINWWRG